MNNCRLLVFMGRSGQKYFCSMLPAVYAVVPGYIFIMGSSKQVFFPIKMLQMPYMVVDHVIAEHHAASQRGETTGVAAVAGGEQHGEHGCC